MPFDMLGSCIFIYVLIPYAALKRGIKIAWTGEDYDGSGILAGIFRNSELPFLKAFEFLGEALPQLVLAIIFTANNYPYLSESQTYFGVSEVTISLVSMIFSAGSLIIGLFTGSLACRKFF